MFIKTQSLILSVIINNCQIWVKTWASFTDFYNNSEHTLAPRVTILITGLLSLIEVLICREIAGNSQAL